MIKKSILHYCGNLLQKFPRQVLLKFWENQYVLGKKRPQYDMPVQILVYHRVLEIEDPFAMAPSNKQLFLQQMQFISKYLRPISLSQLYLELKENAVLPGTICVTFDDGYRDNFLNAFPILKSLNIPATIFVATQPIESNGALWYDRVLEGFRLSDIQNVRLPWLGPEEFNMRFNTQKKQVAHHVLEFLKCLSPIKRDKTIKELFAALKIPFSFSPADLMLSWAQIHEMSQHKIEFGAHTHTHPILSKLTPSEMHLEINQSKHILEEQLQTTIDLFAYPNGKRDDYNSDTISVIQNLGFKLALSTVSGINNSKSSVWELKRRQPWEDTISEMVFRMSMECALS